MAQQQVERPREAGRRRLVPGEQQRHQLVADLLVVHRLAVLEAGGHEQREDVLARVGAALGDLRAQHPVDLPPQRGQAGERIGPAEAAEQQHAELHARRRRAGQQPRRGRPRAALRRAGSVTPKTARRITSSVTACMRGCSANASSSGQRATSRCDHLAHRRLVRAHALAVERRQHQLAAREVLAALEQQQRARAHDRLQRDRPARRQRVAGDRVERADRVRVREHHHRRLEAEEADAERVAEAPPAGLQERDRAQQPAQGLHEWRLGRPWRQRAHRRTVALTATCSPGSDPMRRTTPAPAAGAVTRSIRPTSRRSCASSARSATARRRGCCSATPPPCGDSSRTRASRPRRGSTARRAATSRRRSRRARSCVPTSRASSRTPRRPRARSRSTPTRRLQPGLHQLPQHIADAPRTEKERAKAYGHDRRLLRPFQERDPRALAQQLRPRAPRGHAQARALVLPRHLGRHHQRGRDAVLHGLRAAGAGPRREQGPQVRGPSRVRAEARGRRPTGTPSRGSTSSATARCARRSRRSGTSTRTGSPRRAWRGSAAL